MSYFKQIARPRNSDLDKRSEKIAITRLSRFFSCSLFLIDRLENIPQRTKSLPVPRELRHGDPWFIEIWANTAARADDRIDFCSAPRAENSKASLTREHESFTQLAEKESREEGETWRIGL